MIKKKIKKIKKIGSGGFERSGGDDQQFLFFYVALLERCWGFIVLMDR